MTRPLAALSAVALAAAAVAQEAPRLPATDLLQFREADGTVRDVRSVADWGKRRAGIVRGMEEVMGKLPGVRKRVPTDLQVEAEEDAGSYVRRRVTYQSEPGGRVPAYLLVPKAALKGGARVPAVLCLHPTDDTVGHGVVVGLGGKPGRAYAAELAERGYVALAPGYPLLAGYQPDLKALGWESGTLKAVWDNMRGLDALSALPFVDASRGFAVIGHSLGGHNGVFTAVFDERLTAVVSSCGLDAFPDYYGGDPRNWQPERGWCQTRYMPRLATYRGRLGAIPFDFPELIGALAPRDVLLVAPTRDGNFRADSVDRIAAAARPVFRLFAAEGRLTVEHPDAGHEFPDAMRELAYTRIGTVLKGK